MLYVSFSNSASGAEDGGARLLRQAAKSLLTAPLATSEQWRADHTDAESIIALCKRGEAQSILVVPQASLVAKLELGDRNLKYYQQCAKEEASRLFHGFVAALRAVAVEQICGPSSKHDAASYKDLKAKRAAAALVPPEELFRGGEYAGKYSRYDERGVPTHDAQGVELTKSAQKKLEKLYAAQVKKFGKATAAGAGAAGGEAAAGEEGASGEEGAGETTPSPAADADVPVILPEGACLPDIRHGTFGGRQGFELTSAGPFTHAFVF